MTLSYFLTWCQAVWHHKKTIFQMLAIQRMSSLTEEITVQRNNGCKVWCLEVQNLWNFQFPLCSSHQSSVFHYSKHFRYRDSRWQLEGPRFSMLCSSHLFHVRIRNIGDSAVSWEEQKGDVSCVWDDCFSTEMQSVSSSPASPWQSLCACQLPPYHQWDTSCSPLLRQSRIHYPGPFQDSEQGKVPPFPRT